MDGHFYLTLSSKVTILPEPIRLSDEYEVGVSEIVYPHTWYNVDNDDERYWIAVYDIVTTNLLVPRIPIKSGFYEDGETFAASLTHQATRAFVDVPAIETKFTFDRHLARIRMQVLNSHQAIVTLSTDLLTFMGFAPKMLAKKKMDLVGRTPFNVNRGLDFVYVYCDVASHGIVGDTKAPLLRVFNPIGKHGDVIRLTFDEPHYVPVGRREFSSVTLSINNENNEPLAIRSGRFVTTLHFRRRQR